MANLFQKAASFFRLRSDFTTRPLGQSPIQVGQFPVYPTWNMEAFIRAYQNNSTVYTIVHLMAAKFAFIPRYLYQIKSEGMTAEEKKKKRGAIRSYRQMVRSKDPNLSNIKLKKLINKAYSDDVVEDQPLSQLLAQPNPYMGQDSFYGMIYTFKKLTGNSFVWLNRGDNDNIEGDARLDLEVLDMWVLPAQYVTIRVNRDVLFGEIIGYTFYDSGTPIYLAKEDVIHWKDPNPVYDSYTYQQYYGMSPLQPGMKLLAQDDAARDAAVAMFQNGGARGVLSNETFNNLSKEQVWAADEAINTKINNKQMKSAVVQLPGKWVYQYMGQNAVDMDLIEAQDRTFQRICNLLGCNPQLFETGTTFNNVEQARKDLITNAILPDACSYKDEENRMLLRAFGYKQSDYCIDVDPTDLPELANDMDKMTTRVISNWTLTPNERREELGFDSLPDPNMDLIYAPNNQTLLDDLAMPPLDPNALGMDAGNSQQDNQPNAGQPVSNVPKGYSGNWHQKRLPLAEVDEIWGKAITKNKNGKPL